MEEERKRELSELYHHMKTTYEAKFKLLEKDVEYLGEVQKYLSSVENQLPRISSCSRQAKSRST